MTYWTSTKNTCTSCTWFVNSNMPSWGRQSVAEQEGQLIETEATGAPQKHHHTLNQ